MSETCVFNRSVHEQETRVRQAGQRIGQRVVARLLVEHRVPDDRRGLFADTVEEPAVVIAVERWVDVIDAERADEAIVELERAHQR